MPNIIAPKTVSVATIIARNNKKFRKATPAQKRVLIAQEVLDQLTAERFFAKEGAFFRMAPLEMNKIEDKDSIQTLFLSRVIDSCRVCALGGLMMGCTILNNKEKVKDLTDDFYDLGYQVKYNRKVGNGLTTLFKEDQLKLIEIAFESGRGYFNNWATKDYDEGNAAIEFGNNFETANDRMVGIMKNIVENKGTFKP